MVIVDTTYHATASKCMENLVLMNRRQRTSQRHTRHHTFVMGVLLTETGARLPLPRRSYYTKQYCEKHQRRHRTQVQLAAEMLQALRVPDDVDVTVVYDSAFDARAVHRVCRSRGFREVFPLDPNRNLSRGPDATGPALAGQKVVHWTRTWSREEFTTLDLQSSNEDHVFVRRRHRDNLKDTKTQRHYVLAARAADVSHLGSCLVVASYKENEKVPRSEDPTSDWWSVHTSPVRYLNQQRRKPHRWHSKVLACTDSTATARQVVEWYEIRWQIEIYFRELKSRLQLRGYVLKQFEAVERYLDLLLMGQLLLEHERLRQLRRRDGPQLRVGSAAVHTRTTDSLRSLEATCQQWNVDVLERRLRTEGGRRRLLRELRQAPCHVA
jgi:hypothetical protein